MTLLFTWIACFWIGFSLLDFGFTHFTFSAAMRQAGSSIATLGFAASPTASLTTLDIVTGITGMVVVALQIAYLPTLYSAYNRRESLITVLSARGGEPAWGPEILARHVLARSRRQSPRPLQQTGKAGRPRCLRATPATPS